MVMQNQAAHGQAPGRLQAGPSRQHPVDFKMVETLLSHLQQSPTAQAARVTPDQWAWQYKAVLTRAVACAVPHDLQTRMNGDSS